MLQTLIKQHSIVKLKCKIGVIEIIIESSPIAMLNLSREIAASWFYEDAHDVSEGVHQTIIGGDGNNCFD